MLRTNLFIVNQRVEVHLFDIVFLCRKREELGQAKCPVEVDLHFRGDDWAEPSRGILGRRVQREQNFRVAGLKLLVEIFFSFPLLPI